MCDNCFSFFLLETNIRLKSWLTSIASYAVLLVSSMWRALWMHCFACMYGKRLVYILCNLIDVSSDIFSFLYLALCNKHDNKVLWQMLKCIAMWSSSHGKWTHSYSLYGPSTMPIPKPILKSCRSPNHIPIYFTE